MRHGFTLVELIVVLTIVALLFVVAAPYMGNVLPGMQLKSNALEVAAALRESRSRAITSNSDVVFRLDVDRHQYSINADNKVLTLANNDTIAFYSARQEGIKGSIGGIRFFPDGTSTGGRIVFSNAKTTYKVSVDWLTGRVVVEN